MENSASHPGTVGKRQRTSVSLNRARWQSCILCTAYLRRRTLRRVRLDHIGAYRAWMSAFRMPGSGLRWPLLLPGTCRWCPRPPAVIPHSPCSHSPSHYATIGELCPESTLVAWMPVHKSSYTIYHTDPRCCQVPGTRRGFALPSVGQCPRAILSSRRFGQSARARAPAIFHLACRLYRPCWRKLPRLDMGHGSRGMSLTQSSWRLMQFVLP